MDTMLLVYYTRKLMNGVYCLKSQDSDIVHVSTLSSKQIYELMEIILMLRDYIKASSR